MDSKHIDIAQACLDASHNGTLSFPEIVSKLNNAGFEGYTVDFRQNTAVYFLRDGSHTVLCMPPSNAEVAPRFNASGVEDCVRSAQKKEPGYTYKGFCEKVKASGCAGYMVSFPGERVVYFGRTAETHVELFPR